MTDNIKATLQAGEYVIKGVSTTHTASTLAALTALNTKPDQQGK